MQEEQESVSIMENSLNVFFIFFVSYCCCKVRLDLVKEGEIIKHFGIRT